MFPIGYKIPLEIVFTRKRFSRYLNIPKIHYKTRSTLVESTSVR